MLNNILRTLLGFTNYLFHPLVYLLHLFYDNEKKNNIIFIIGPPRSGTTYIYQKFVYELKYQPIYNLENILQNYPNIQNISSLFLNLIPYNENYKSVYGKTQKINGCSEGGGIFNKYLNNKYSSRIDSFKKFIFLKSIYNPNIVIKNVYNSGRISELINIFPNCKFVVVDRFFSDIVNSILNARVENRIPDTQSWSYIPFDDSEWKKNQVTESVNYQVKAIYKQIKKYSERYEKKFFYLSYDQSLNASLLQNENLINFIINE